MISYIYVTPQGEIVGAGNCQQEVQDKLEIKEGAQLVLNVKAQPIVQYYKNGTVLNKPAKPEGYFKFNLVTEQWEFDPVEADIQIKAKRNELLAATDFYDNLSAQQRFPEEVLAAWATYRQALRDIPSQPGYPLTVEFPTPPNQG